MNEQIIRYKQSLPLSYRLFTLSCFLIGLTLALFSGYVKYDTNSFLYSLPYLIIGVLIVVLPATVLFFPKIIKIIKDEDNAYLKYSIAGFFNKKIDINEIKYIIDLQVSSPRDIKAYYIMNSERKTFLKLSTFYFDKKTINEIIATIRELNPHIVLRKMSIDEYTNFIPT